MTDLHTVLPDLSITAFGNVIPSLEKSHITVSDLLTLDAVDVAKRAQLPAREVRRLTDAILQALHLDLGLGSAGGENEGHKIDSKRSSLANGVGFVAQRSTISLLDGALDAALGGGIPTGYLTEIVGESGVGKTQLLLTLLLAVQLPPSRGGLSRSALYISTEAPLPTSRLSQMLALHPFLACIDDGDSQKPTLHKILSIQTPDLESQEHILRYQLPIAIRRYDVGLVIIDSITANYRAEFVKDSGGTKGGKERRAEGSTIGVGNNKGPAAMAKRTSQLLEVGTLLRNLARTEDVAVVVANQVADRFDTIPFGRPVQQQDGSQLTVLPNVGPVAASQNSPTSSPGITTKDVEGSEFVTLDHQQRFFTGWGDSRPGWIGGTGMLSGPGYKTPSLGLVWANQIAARIALVKSRVIHTPVSSAATTTRELDASRATYEETLSSGQENVVHNSSNSSSWRRHMKVVFAPWVEPSDSTRGIELAIWQGGIKAQTPR